VVKACALTPHHLPGLAELLEQGLSRRAGRTTTTCSEEGSRRGDSWSGVRVHAEEEEATTAVDAAVQVHNEVATAMPPSFPLLPPITRLSLVKRTPKRQCGKQKQPRKKLKRRNAKNARRETNAECTQTLTGMHERESERKTGGEDEGREGGRRKRGEGGGGDGRRRRGESRRPEKTRGQKTGGEDEGRKDGRRKRGRQKTGGEDEGREDSRRKRGGRKQEEKTRKTESMASGQLTNKHTHLIAANHTTTNPD